MEPAFSVVFARRVLRHLTVERSYERYYSAAGWDRSYAQGYALDTLDQAARYGALVGLLERYDQGQAILDLGCGEGLLEEKLRKLTASPLVGVDYSQRAIELAGAKHIPECRFICADFRSSGLQERFGIIVLNESLYYLEDALGTLQALSRQLTAEGVLIVSMFQTLVTRRIWKAILAHFRTVQSVWVQDETHGQGWRIRVLRPQAPSGRPATVSP